MSFQLYVGDRSPSIPWVFSIDGQEQDVSGHTITFSMTDRDTGLYKIDHAPATFADDGTDGACFYAWASADVDTEAVYNAWAEATLGSLVVQSLDLGEVRVDQHGILTVDTVRSLVEIGITDDALQLLLDDALQLIANRFGDPFTEQVTVEAYGERTIRLLRPAVALTLVEDTTVWPYTSWSTVDPADYLLEDGGRTLTRINTTSGWGVYPSGWGRRTRITYRPRSEVATRRRVTIDLVRLACVYRGLMLEQVGDYKMQAVDYTDEQVKLLSQIQRTRSAVRFA